MILIDLFYKQTIHLNTNITNLFWKLNNFLILSAFEYYPCFCFYLLTIYSSLQIIKNHFECNEENISLDGIIDGKKYNFKFKKRLKKVISAWVVCG